MSDAYKVCPKCGLRHSALVRHRCAKPKGQDKKPPALDPKDLDASERGGGTDSLDQHKGAEGEGEKDGDSGKGEGEGDGQAGDSEGGEGEGKEGDGQGQGQGEGEAEAPAPKPPEPEARPEAIVCTVLKYAALCAQCAKNGVIEVTLSEDGLFVYGHNGDLSAYDVMPWGEFEKRSTLDGEFYVKDVIDQIDGQLTEPVTMEDKAKKAMRDVRKAKAEEAKAPKLEAETPKAKAKAKAPKAPKLTLPMFVGQRVVCRDGKVREVAAINGDAAKDKECGRDLWWSDLGRMNKRTTVEASTDAVHDAEKPKLTLPLTTGQKVVLRNGSVGTVIGDTFNTVRNGADFEDGFTVRFDSGPEEDGNWNYWARDGLFIGSESDGNFPRHIVADAE